MKQCRCGVWITNGRSCCKVCSGDVADPGESPPAVLSCIHRGSHVGRLECNCGSLYHCELLGKLCSSRAPMDNLVMGIVGDEHVWLTSDNYQACEACASFTVSPNPESNAMQNDVERIDQIDALITEAEKVCETHPQSLSARLSLQSLIRHRNDHLDVDDGQAT